MTEYQRYQLQWMIDHGYSIQDLVRELRDYQYDDPEDSDRISAPIDELFSEWEHDVGFGSEIWACQAEWSECEGKNPKHELQIDEVWPVSTEAHKNGGIGIDWSGDIGFGQWVAWWGEDGKLHADTERLDSNESKKFTKAILERLADFIVIDD